MFRIILKILVLLFTFVLIAELFFLYNYQVSVKTGRVSYLDILLDNNVVADNFVQKGELFKFILMALVFTTLVIISSMGYLIGRPPPDDENGLRDEIYSAESDDFFKSGDQFLHRKRKK